MSSPYTDPLKDLFGELRIPNDSSVLAAVPKAFVLSAGYFTPAPDNKTQATHTLKEVLGTFVKSLPEVIEGNRGHDLPVLSATFHSLVAARVGRSPRVGLPLAKPTNAAQVPPAAVSLWSSSRRSPQVLALVDKEKVEGLPKLLGQFAVRFKMRAEALQHYNDMDRAVTEVLIEIDNVVRPAIVPLRPLANSDAGLSLKPLFALVEEPAEKAQKTLRVREEGRQQGIAEATAEEPQSAAPGAAPNPAVIVVPPAAPASTPAAARPAAAAAKRKRPR